MNVGRDGTVPAAVATGGSTPADCELLVAARELERSNATLPLSEQALEDLSRSAIPTLERLSTTANAEDLRQAAKTLSVKYTAIANATSAAESANAIAALASAETAAASEVLRSHMSRCSWSVAERARLVRCWGMPVITAVPLKVSREERVELERMARSTSLPHRCVVQASASL